MLRQKAFGGGKNSMEPGGMGIFLGVPVGKSTWTCDDFKVETWKFHGVTQVFGRLLRALFLQSFGSILS